MTQLKPSNMFDFFAPSGGGAKIADFITKSSNSAGTNPAGQPIITSAPVGAANINSTANIPDSSTGSNTWKWVLGLALAGTIGYLAYVHYQEKKKRELLKA